MSVEFDLRKLEYLRSLMDVARRVKDLVLKYDSNTE